MYKFSIGLILIFGMLIPEVIAQEAEPTDIVVRAKAKDAKFIGTSMGGVVVAIREAKTGRLLAEGKIQGSTGSTDLLMKTPLTRDMRLSKGGAAHFDTTLWLQRPVLATIEAHGPLGQPQSAITTSTQVWLIPGRDMDGDGIVLEFPGFSVDLLQPRAHEMYTGPDSVTIKANVVMMCGCPTRPGGLWNSKQYEMTAWILHKGALVDKVPLQFAGQTSLYKGKFKPMSSGTYEVVLATYDRKQHNTGVDRTTFIYSEE